MRNLVSSLIGACTLIALPAQAADWSDTFLGYRHGTSFQEPGCNQDITKDILTLSHVSGYKYGSNFFNVDALTSASGKNTIGSDSAHSTKYDSIDSNGTGAQEIYMVYAHTLSFSKVSGSKVGFGPVRDIGLVTGFDRNAKNTSFAPKVQKYYVGPKFSFALPKGFLDLSLLYIKEKNHNGSKGVAVDFDGTYRVALAGLYPLALGSVNTNLKGWANITGPKGKDGFGAETKTETQAEVAWMFDIGKMMGRPGAFYIGPGFQYWNNKFGGQNVDDGSLSVFSQNRRTSAFQIQAEIHF